MNKRINKFTTTKTKREKIGIATKFLKEKVIEYLTEAPIAKYAYSKASVPKATYYKWRNTDEKFLYASNEAIIQGKISVNDLARSKLIKMIHNDNITAIIFWLKNNDPDFNPKVVLEIKREEPLSKEQTMEIKTALSRIGLASIFENNRVLRKKFMESKDFDQKFKGEIEEMKKNVRLSTWKPLSSS